jgi:hypothetical protein
MTFDGRGHDDGDVSDAVFLLGGNAEVYHPILSVYVSG